MTTEARHGLPWSPSEDEQLLELVASGLSAKQIGVRIGRPTCGVESRIMKLGLQRFTKMKQPFVIFQTRCGCTRVEHKPHGWAPEGSGDIHMRIGDGRVRVFRWLGRFSDGQHAPIFEEIS